MVRESLDSMDSGVRLEEIWREVAEVLLANNELMYVE
jgi:hypothetical protein